MTGEDLSCQEAVELVTDYLEAVLLPELNARFEAHLAACPGCANYLQQMEQTLKLLRRFAGETTPPETKQALLEMFRGWQK